MTIRKLPEMRRPEKVDCSFSLSDKAVKLYRPLEAPQAAASENTISVLDVIGYDMWTGEGVTAKRVGAALRSIGEKPVTVLINSPGGDFFEGVTIYNMLREHPAHVTVKILGLAASAASVIAMAADRIEIASLGFFMIHNTQWVAAGDRHVMKETHDIMQVFDEACADMYAKRTGQDVGAISAMLDAETWMAGQKAVEEGFADAVTDMDAEDKLQNRAPALYRMEALLTTGKPVPRSEVRRLSKEIIQEISEGMPGAANGHATPGAGTPAVEDDSTHLSLALARLKLARA